MSCREDIKKAIFDDIDKALVDNRNTFTRISDDTIQINNRADNKDSKATKNTQAYQIAQTIIGRVKGIYNGYVTGYISEPSAYNPITVTFTISDAYVDHEFNKLNSDDTLYQTNSLVEQSKASPETLAKVKEFLKRIGVDTTNVDKITDSEGNPIDANGRAVLLKQLIEVVNGKEDVALTEEAMHFAVEIIEQTNPALFNSMLSSVGNYDMYKSIISDNSPSSYRNIYQKDGKPDIRKIKKEVMGKLLAEAVIETSEGTPSDLRGQTLTWWEHIKNWLKSLFGKTNINPFDIAAKDVLESKLQATVERSDETYLQTSSDKQTSIDDKIRATQKQVVKEYKDEKENDSVLSDDTDVNNWYVADGKRIKNRVTDLVKAWYRKTFKGKEFSARQQKDNERRRVFGVEGHIDFEKAVERYIDPETNLPRTDQKPAFESATGIQGVYDKIDNYVKELISHFPEGTKFYPETVIFDKDFNKGEGEAGTIDLLAVEPNGRTSVYDWKFMLLHEDATDVPWFKQNAFETQIREYRRILKDKYGVTEFGATRAIPILMEVEDQLFSKNKPELIGISVGSADTSKIAELKYVPIPVDETTGIAPLDKKIKSLIHLYERESKKSVEEGRRDLKSTRLNTLKEVIRLLRAQTNLYVFTDVMKANVEDMKKVVETWNSIKDKGVDELEDKIKEEFLFNVMEKLTTAEIYEDVDIVFDTELSALPEAQAKLIKEELSVQSSAVRINRDRLKKIQKEFADKFIGQKYDVFTLLSPERIVKGLANTFRPFSKLGQDSLNIMYRMVGEAKSEAKIEALKDNEHILAIRNKTVEWAKSKGIKIQDAIRSLYKKNTEGKRVHELIDEIRPEFKTLFEEKAAKADEEWFKENIDLEAYRKQVAPYIARRTQEYEDTTYTGTQQQQEYKESEDVRKLNERFNIDHPTFTGWDNRMMRENIKDRAKWYTKEYKVIVGTPLEEIYKYQQKMNRFADDIGYLDHQRVLTFVPFTRKSLEDKIFWGGNPTHVQDWIDDLALSDDPYKYGAKDENGNLIASLPKYYTSDIGKTITDEKGKETVDYTNVSEDVFKNLIAFTTQLHKYNHLSRIKNQIETLQVIEEFKGHLETDNLGHVITEDGQLKTIGEDKAGGNAENTKLFEDFKKMVFYGQKYPRSSSDTALPVARVFNNIKKAINKVAGRQVFSTEDNPTPTSMIKTMDAVNRVKRLQVLSLNPISGFAVLMGNNVQISAQSGKYFSTREFTRNQLKLLTHNFSFKEKALWPALIDTFLPLNEDMSNELLKKAGVKKLTEKSIGDWLMITMSKPDELLEKGVFMTLLDNSMIDDSGRIVNIKSYVKSKYPSRNSSGAEYKRTKELINKEVDELKRTKSITKTAELVDGKLHIPGFDISNTKEILRLAHLSKDITQNANGNITEDNKSQMNINALLNSAMVFRNWIPGLLFTRFQGLIKTADHFEGETYDIGRLTLLWKLFSDSIKNRSNNIFNIMKMNDKGLSKIDSLYNEYKEQYQKRTGKEFTMDKDDFFDMIHNNLRNQVKELGILLTFMASMLALGAMAPAPGDDDKRMKNLYKIAYRTLDKMTDELRFYYNPMNLQQVLQGGPFPALGILSDGTRFMSNMTNELFGNEAAQKKAQPTKTFLKLLPVTNSWLLYVGAVDPDLAKELQISIPTTNQLR